MVTDQQVRKLMILIQTTSNLEEAANKAGMSPRTAQKYRKINKLPSECQPIHDWRTRPDPFASVWGEILPLLEMNPLRKFSDNIPGNILTTNYEVFNVGSRSGGQFRDRLGKSFFPRFTFPANSANQTLLK